MNTKPHAISDTHSTLLERILAVRDLHAVWLILISAPRPKQTTTSGWCVPSASNNLPTTTTPNLEMMLHLVRQGRRPDDSQSGKPASEYDSEGIAERFADQPADTPSWHSIVAD